MKSVFLSSLRRFRNYSFSFYFSLRGTCDCSGYFLSLILCGSGKHPNHTCNCREKDSFKWEAESSLNALPHRAPLSCGGQASADRGVARLREKWVEGVRPCGAWPFLLTFPSSPSSFPLLFPVPHLPASASGWSDSSRVWRGAAPRASQGGGVLWGAPRGWLNTVPPQGAAPAGD